MRPSKFVERGKIDTLSQIHDLSLSWFTQWCFNATFNKFAVLSWRSVLLVEETEDREKTNLISYVRRSRVLKYLNHK
jgi:hypothetical protein